MADQKWLEKLDAKLDKHDEKISDIKDEIVEVKQILSKNTSSLEYHIKRTDILESKFHSVPSRILIWLSILSAILVIASKIF